jgi:hypothetical protein
MPHQCTTCGHVFPDGSKEMLSGCPDCGGNAFQFHPKGTDIPEEPPDADPPEPETPNPDRSSEGSSAVGRAASTVREFVGGDGGSTGSADAGTSSSPPANPSASTGTGEEPRADAPWPDDTADGAAGEGTAGEGNAAEEGDADEDDGIIVADETPVDGEDAAQTSARTDLAGPDDLPERSAADASEPGDAGGVSDAGGVESAAGNGPGSPPTPGSGDGPLGGGDGRVVSEPSADEQPGLAELREQLNEQFESIKIVEPGEYELNLMELFDREEYIIALQENGRYVIQVPENWLGDRPGDE